MIFKKSKDNIFNKNLGKSQRYTAFTLAEVLIVLAIIGVVAALTIPMLMNNYQKTQQVVALKKVYSQITEAIDRLVVDENVEKFSDTTLHDQTTADAKAFFKKYFRVSKFCAPEDYASCFSDVTSLDKSNFGSPAQDKTCVILKDGTSICLGISDNGNLPPVFVVDTNGLNKPNIGGRDIFSFDAYWDGSLDEIMPEDIAIGTHICSGKGNKETQCSARDSRKNQCETSVYGIGCFSRIIDDGWKMDY